MRIVELSSPFANEVGRIEFPWRGPGHTLPVELRVTGAGRGSLLRAEIWTNANHSDLPTRYEALPMTRAGEDGAVLFVGEIPVERVGNYRATARVRRRGEEGWSWARDHGCPDLCFRPRHPDADLLDIEVISVANVNATAGRGGTLEELLAPGDPLRDGRFTLEWLAAQGRNAVWLLPPFEPSRVLVSPQDSWGSPYAARDFFAVNPALSGRARGRAVAEARRVALEAFRAVVERSHALGLRVILDLALSHVGHGHRFHDLFVTRGPDGEERREVRANDFSQVVCTEEQRRDIERRLRASAVSRDLERIAPWMFGSLSGFPRGAASLRDIAPGGWFEWPDALQLNHGRRRISFRTFEEADPPNDEQRAVQAWLGRVLRFWAVDMGVDGFRLDHLAGLPRRLLEHGCNEMQAEVDRVDPGRVVLLIGEDDDTAHETHHFVDRIQSGWPGELLGDPTAARLERMVESPWFCHLLGLSSHDEDRPLRRLRGDDALALCLARLMRLVGGSVLEVAGDTLGEEERLQVRRPDGLEAPTRWPERARRFAEALGHASMLRRRYAALRTGRRGWPRSKTGARDPRLVALTRIAAGPPAEILLVLANLDRERPLSSTLALDDDTAAHLEPQRRYRWRDLFDDSAEVGVDHVAGVAAGELPGAGPCTGGALVDRGVAVTLRPLELRLLYLEPLPAPSPGPDADGDPDTAVHLEQTDGAGWPVTFELHHTAQQQVALRGDFPEWRTSHRMEEVQPGRYRVQLVLPPGVYRYRYCLDELSWCSDPQAALRDRADRFDNAVRVVGGCSSPRFAPDRRHLVHRADGTVVIHVEVEGGASRAVHAWLRWGADAGSPPPVPLLLRPVTEYGGLRALRGVFTLDATARPSGISFDRERGPVFPLPAPQQTIDAAPAWARSAIFYGVFLDRWHRGRRSPPDPRAVERTAPSTADTFYGGDLDGVRESLDELVDLGVDAIVLTPIHRSPTPHRYDAVDLSEVDPRLGGEAALRRLIDQAHARGLRLILDLSATHVNEAHPAFVDLLRHQERSAYRSWFQVKRFPVRPRDRTTVALYPTRPELPMLNLAPGPARAHVLAVVDALVQLGIDGLRLDAMSDAPPDFWRTLRARARALNPELLLLGEVVGDRPHLYAEHRGVDLATDFAQRRAVIDFFGLARRSAAAFWEEISRIAFRKGPFEPHFSLLFLDNHDTARFGSICGYFDRLRLALTYLLFRPEPVWITYGTELGLCSGVAEAELDDAWPERLPMPAAAAESTQIRRLVQALARMRRELSPLREGTLELLLADGPLLVLARRSARGEIVGCFNAGDAAVSLRGLPAVAELLLEVNTPAQSFLEVSTATAAEAQLAPRAARLYWSHMRLP